MAYVCILYELGSNHFALDQNPFRSLVNNGKLIFEIVQVHGLRTLLGVEGLMLISYCATAIGTVLQLGPSLIVGGRTFYFWHLHGDIGLSIGTVFTPRSLWYKK